MIFRHRWLLCQTIQHWSWRNVSRNAQPVRYRAESKVLLTQKIDTPEYRAILTAPLLKLAEIFKKNQHEIRIAGGAVRDLLMGIVPHDIDFATTATPEQMKTILTQESIRMINCNGEKHGTITARVDDQANFEITTLRVDLLTDGRHAVVEYTQDWYLDASRRDLTINALFLDLHGTIYDYFNGLDDLKHRRVRFVGDPMQRIQEDYLRILRYFRFFGRLAADFSTHDEETLDAIAQTADGLKNISGERLWIELKRIAEGRNAGSVLKRMFQSKVREYLAIPANVDLNELEEHWRKCQNAQPDALTILSKLFRDLTELETFENRMKYSNEYRRLGQLIVNYRHLIARIPSSTIDPWKSYKDLLIDLHSADNDVKKKIIELMKYKYDFDGIPIINDWSIPKFPINPAMFVLKGIKQGSNYKLILEQLRQAWKQSNYQLTERQLLDDVLPKILSEPSAIMEDSFFPLPPAFSLTKRKKTKPVKKID